MLVKLYLPTAVDDAAHAAAKRRMANMFGGVTAYDDARGAWVSDDGGIVEESVAVYESVLPSTADGGAAYADMVTLARDVKQMTDETEILAYVDDGSGETIRV